MSVEDNRDVKNEPTLLDLAIMNEAISLDKKLDVLEHFDEFDDAHKRILLASMTRFKMDLVYLSTILEKE
ncbi:MAG: hypothetical protein OEY89_18330 [Gammaproteobacteria bacterium]|nr:hypothetical protein [Gammaproteobacteria bacterium]